MGSRQLWPWVCADYHQTTYLEDRETRRAARPRCSRCGSLWLQRPHKGKTKADKELGTRQEMVDVGECTLSESTTRSVAARRGGPIPWAGHCPPGVNRNRFFASIGSRLPPEKRAAVRARIEENRKAGRARWLREYHADWKARNEAWKRREAGGAA